MAAPKKLTLKILNERIEKLEAQVQELTGKKLAVKNTPSIQKTEGFNGEVPSEKKDTSLGMTEADRFQSVVNAVRILPPNFVDVNGRHSLANVSALCGFQVTDEIMDEVVAFLEPTQ